MPWPQKELNHFDHGVVFPPCQRSCLVLSQRVGQRHVEALRRAMTQTRSAMTRDMQPVHGTLHHQCTRPPAVPPPHPIPHAGNPVQRARRCHCFADLQQPCKSKSTPDAHAKQPLHKQELHSRGQTSSDSTSWMSPDTVAWACAAGSHDLQPMLSDFCTNLPGYNLWILVLVGSQKQSAESPGRHQNAQHCQLARLLLETSCR